MGPGLDQRILVGHVSIPSASYFVLVGGITGDAHPIDRINSLLVELILSIWFVT